jgi:hypothetical protein
MFDFPAAPTDKQTIVFPEGPAYQYNLASTAWDRVASATVVSTVPVITSIAPQVVGMADPNTTLRVTGSNFAANSKILFDMVEQATTFVSATELTCPISPAALGYSTWSVQVRTDLYESATDVTLYVVLHPTVTTIAPTTASIAAGPFQMTFTGDNFSVFPQYPPRVTVDGVDQVCTPGNTPSSLTATITPTGAARTALVQMWSGPVQASTPPKTLTYTALATRGAPASGPMARGVPPVPPRPVPSRR